MRLISDGRKFTLKIFLSVFAIAIVLVPCYVISASGITTRQAAETNVDKNSSEKTDESSKREAKLDPSQERSAKDGKLVRLTKSGEVWIDTKHKRVIVGGAIAFRKGVLEMFACIKNTKEHESVIAVNAKAYQVHTALLAVGAKPGKPVQYDPTYHPATGPKIKVEVVWKNKEGKEERRLAQEMIRNVRTQKNMKHDWVFAGSYFWTDEETKKKYYQAEGGELICVSNFSTATMDLPIESSQSTGQLLFEANTKNIPALGTKVRLVLTPVLPQTRKTADVTKAAQPEGGKDVSPTSNSAGSN